MACLFKARGIAYHRDSWSGVGKVRASETAIKATYRFRGGVGILQLGSRRKMHRHASVRAEAAYSTHELHGLHLPAVLHLDKIGDRLGIGVGPLQRTECRTLTVAGGGTAAHSNREFRICAIGKLMRKRSPEGSGRPVSVADLSAEREGIVRKDKLIDVEGGCII